MVQHPEDIRRGHSAGPPKGDVRPELQSQVAPTVPDTKPGIPTTIPLVDYRLISVPAEAERRANLLSRVTVDANGVAHGTDDRSVTETLLVAVRINDNRVASLAPFVADQEQLRLVLPSDRLSRIGFFVGYSSSQEVSAVLRMGLYPGAPLTTQTVADDRTVEVMYGLGGIKSSEADEQRWAIQVGLFSTLGFDPTHARGMFNKNHRPNPKSDIWKESPLIIMPDEILDMVGHYDPKDVKKDEFQVHFYGIKPAPFLPEFPSAHYADTLGGDYPSTTRGGGRFYYGAEPTLRSLGVEPTRGLGIGFGEAVNRTAQTRPATIDVLCGAFKIIVTPGC